LSIKASVPHTAPITFGPHGCGSLPRGADHEWLVTDGLGGFATGTICGLRTRRYHSLLTVADPVTAVRRVAVAALDLTLTLPSGAKVPLFTHEGASGAVSPAGHRHLETFTLADGLPRWRWRVGDVVVEREIALRHGHPSLAVVHRVVSAPEPVGLAVAVMCTWRDANDLRAAGEPLHAEQVADGVAVEGAYRVAGTGWQPAGEWHLGAYAREEAARGLPATEDLWLAGTYVEQVNPGAVSEISAWAGALDERPPAASAVVAAARERARGLVTVAKAEGLTATLVLAADAFVVRDADGPDVLAGYPWFGSYLADTMTAYEGLFLDTGRTDEGRELLTVRARAAARAVREPSAQPPPWGPHDAVDSPLWLAGRVPAGTHR
jgi:predicted glycogen debranching enzyme